MSNGCLLFAPLDMPPFFPVPINFPNWQIKEDDFDFLNK